jgi:magnesium transporter
MLFFSELIGRHVFSETQRALGTLRDILFINADIPHITKIVIKTPNKHQQTIPITTLKQVNSHVIVKRSEGYPEKSGRQDLSIAKVLLDQQIIDLVGNKVVRVNDVVIQDVPTLSVSAIDIGITGILRRLHIDQSFQKLYRLFHLEMPVRLLSWGDILTLDLQGGQIQLKQHEEQLSKIREEDLADYLEMTNIENVHTFIQSLSIHKAAEVIENLTINYQVDLFRKFEPSKSAELIARIDPDEAVDILLALQRIRRDKIMEALPRKKREELHRLMTFSRTPVGKLMTSEYLAVDSHATASEIAKIIKRDTTEFSSLSAIYVLNRDDQIVGVFNPHELIMQNSDAPAYRFMVPEPIVVLLTTPIEVVMYKFLKYKIPAIPVINREKKVIGVITIDDVSKILLKKLQ